MRLLHDLEAKLAELTMDEAVPLLDDSQSVDVAAGVAALQLAVEQGCKRAVARIVQALLGPAAVVDGGGRAPLHVAACTGRPAAVQLLLQAAPDTVTVPDPSGCLPLHCAVRSLKDLGCQWCSASDVVKVVEQLLQAAPQAAAVADRAGCSPLLYAATALQHAHPAEAVQVVRLMLAAAPYMAAVPKYSGETPLLAAAMALKTHPVEALQALHLLLETVPPAAALAGSSSTRGWNPLMLAAVPGHAQAVQLLLAAAPQAAAAVEGHGGRSALSFAAQSGDPHTVGVLLAAAPQMAVLRDFSGRTPLDWAADHNRKVVPLLVMDQLQREGAGQGVTHILGMLHRLWQRCDVFGTDRMSVGISFASILSRHAPTAAQWELVPPSCAGLAAALPDVLLRSEAEAGLLVAHLPTAQRARLRAAALCLAHVAGAQLPTAICRTIIGLCGSPDDVLHSIFTW